MITGIAPLAQNRADDSIASVIKRIDDIVNDSDQYGLDEVRPSAETIQSVRNLLRSMGSIGCQNLPRTYISVYYGEISISWKTDKNLVRLSFRPNGSIELYRQADYRDSARGEAIPVTVDDNQQVADYIRWLSDDARAANPERPNSNR